MLQPADVQQEGQMLTKRRWAMTFPQPDSMTFELIISCIRIHFNEKMQYKFIVNPNILILAQKHLGTFTGKQCSIKQQYKIQNNFKSVSKLEDKWSL